MLRNIILIEEDKKDGVSALYVKADTKFTMIDK